jgi:AcrR family transcriptional regulator
MPRGKYDRTEQIEAASAARRAMMFAAAIAIIKRHGMEGLGVDAIAERGKFSVGIIYKEFPDIDELRAAVIGHLLARDVAAIREATSLGPTAHDARERLASALAVLFASFDNTRLASAAMSSPIYREGIRAELERLLKAATNLTPKARATAAAGAMGALYGLHDVGDVTRNRAQAAVLFALQGIGIAHARMLA